MNFAIHAASIPAAFREHSHRSSGWLYYFVCALLLGLSIYGFWCLTDLHAGPGAPVREDLFMAMMTAVLPLAFFLFLVLTSERRFARVRMAVSYQDRIDQMHKRLNYQEDLLRLVMDHYPESVTIYDRQNRYWFVNECAAHELDSEANMLIGCSTNRVLGADRALKLEMKLAEVQAKGEPVRAVEQITGKDGKVRFMQMHYEAIAPFSEFAGGIMVRGEDLTALLVERERREGMLRQVIGTLVAVIDRRDPYAAGHSARVGQLARAIAEEMLLDEAQIETAEIAGSLMNFGKVLVPREILTKTTPLTPDELQRVRDSILTSADILSIIDFTGPVVPTLRQVLERFDGTGAPDALKDEDILITARIVTVANAYVALVSPRAHRPSMEFKDALANIVRDSGKTYDPRVATALSHYIEAHIAKLDWLTRARQG